MDRERVQEKPMHTRLCPESLMAFKSLSVQACQIWLGRKNKLSKHTPSAFGSEWLVKQVAATTSILQLWNDCLIYICAVDCNAREMIVLRSKITHFSMPNQPFQACNLCSWILRAPRKRLGARKQYIYPGAEGSSQWAASQQTFPDSLCLEIFWITRYLMKRWIYW